MDVQTRTSVGEAQSAGFVAGLIEQRGKFLRFVERRVRDRQVAEDILQSAYARVVVQAGSLREEQAGDAWFYRILRNAIIDYYRHRSVEARVMEPLEAGMDAPAEAPVAEANLCPCMGGAIDALKPAYAEVLREVDLGEDAAGTLDAFARRSGITAGNAAVRAHRARKALEQKLRHTCGSCAGAGCLDCTCGQAAAHQG